MTDIELVIKIAKEDYDDLTLTGENTINFGVLLALREAVRNGIPLPKGHGRLIILSEDAVKRELTSLGVSCQYWISEVGLSNATVRIIEADKVESEGKKCVMKEKH